MILSISFLCAYLTAVVLADTAGGYYDKPCNLDRVELLNSGNFSCGYEYPNIDRRMQQPNIQFSKADEGKLYTLLLVNPDFRDSNCPWETYALNWLVVDIDGADLKNGANLSNYREIVPYTAPDAIYGVHRFHTFAFEQQGLSEYDGTDLDDVKNQERFELLQFVENNDLKLKAGFEFLVDSNFANVCPTTAKTVPTAFPTTHSTMPFTSATTIREKTTGSTTEMPTEIPSTTTWKPQWTKSSKTEKVKGPVTEPGLKAIGESSKASSLYVVYGPTILLFITSLMKE